MARNLGPINSFKKDRLAKLRLGIDSLSRNGKIEDTLLLTFIIQELRNLAYDVETSILDENV